MKPPVYLPWKKAREIDSVLRVHRGAFHQGVWVGVIRDTRVSPEFRASLPGKLLHRLPLSTTTEREMRHKIDKILVEEGIYLL